MKRGCQSRDVRVRPGDEVPGRGVQALPERFALAAVRAVARQHVRVNHHSRALRLGDRARVVVRLGVDHEQLVDQRELLHQLAPGAVDDRPDRRRLVERRQNGADRQALLLLELQQPAEVAELGVMEVRLGEPAVDAGRDAASEVCRSVGRFERLGLLGAALEGLAVDLLARLDHDDRRPGVLGDGLGQHAEQRAFVVGHVRRPTSRLRP